jgi:hypothetical protein
LFFTVPKDSVCLKVPEVEYLVLDCAEVLSLLKVPEVEYLVLDCTEVLSLLEGS